MRVLVDCQGVLERSGGMRLFAQELLGAWSGLHSSDDLTVLGPRWLRLPDRVRRVPLQVPNESVVLRALAQLLVTPLVFRLGRFDVLLSANAIMSPLMPRRRTVLVAHDWRHLRRPREFSAAQRVFRRWWSWSARRAGAVVAISTKTSRDTATLVGRRGVPTIANGWDHAAHWGALPPDPEAAVRFPGGYLLTFGHHTNKRPELAIRALARLEDGSGLVILGAADPYRDRLLELATDQGVAERVLLPGFVEDTRYRMLVSHASAILLVSSDEGFGLPLTEALVLGVPAIGTVDSGVGDVFPGLVALAAPEPESIARQVRSAIAAGSRDVASPRTWADAAGDYSDLLRAFLPVAHNRRGGRSVHPPR